MQIQLNQVEIETAIRNYVHEQINVREGMQIDITLKATRGDDGQTAIIDIVPAKVEAPVVTQATSAVAIQRRPRAATPVTPVKVETQAQVEGTESKQDEGNEKTAIEKLQAGEVAGSSTSSAAAATDGIAEDAGQSDTGTAGAQQDSTAEEQPAGEKKSLFSGLSRPKNS